MKTVLLVTSLLAGVAALLFVAQRNGDDVTGFAPRIQDVPQFGKVFSDDVAIENVRYKISAAGGPVMMKAAASVSSFRALVEKWQIRPVEYESGFRYGDGVSDEDFIPDGDRVYVGIGPIAPGARRMVCFYFEPIGEGDSGVLYVHVRY